MSRFMYLSCQLHCIKLPRWAKRWINVRKSFSNFYDCKRMCLHDMLEASGFTFDGQPHSGLDDSKNIARLTIGLLEDGWIPLVNEQMYCKKLEANNRLAAAAFDDSVTTEYDSTTSGTVETLSREQAKALGSDSEQSSDGSDVGEDKE